MPIIYHQLSLSTTHICYQSIYGSPSEQVPSQYSHKMKHSFLSLSTYSLCFPIHWHLASRSRGAALRGSRSGRLSSSCWVCAASINLRGLHLIGLPASKWTKQTELKAARERERERERLQLTTEHKSSVECAAKDRLLL